MTDAEFAVFMGLDVDSAAPVLRSDEAQQIEDRIAEFQEVASVYQNVINRLTGAVDDPRSFTPEEAETIVRALGWKAQYQDKIAALETRLVNIRRSTSARAHKRRAMEHASAHRSRPDYFVRGVTRLADSISCNSSLDGAAVPWMWSWAGEFTHFSEMDEIDMTPPPGWWHRRNSIAALRP